MPRNFDDLKKDVDLEFVIGGESFKMRYVRPEVIAAWEDDSDNLKASDVLKLLDKRVLLFLEANGDSEARWTKLREREEDPITATQINELLSWMLEIQSSRPTNPPSPSASGRGSTAVSSKGA